ncbi:hypothetical protein [Duganella vulcania]|uniref:hypothetical protein n=1 Tax=Duganella vulcania TaxID=2692166 RepID=UPI0015839D31|nr:hypothetical protein [Duganella vulcania]
MAELYGRDPAFAAYMICSVLEDGDEFEMSYLLSQMVEVLDKLWDITPGLEFRLRNFYSRSDWLHWESGTVDGWYCVPDETGFDVYYQEGAHHEPGRHFLLEKDAIRCAIKSAVVSMRR